MQLTLLITYAIIICQTPMIEEAYCISLIFEGSTRVQIYLSNFMQAKLPKLLLTMYLWYIPISHLICHGNSVRSCWLPPGGSWVYEREKILDNHREYGYLENPLTYAVQEISRIYRGCVRRFSLKWRNNISWRLIRFRWWRTNRLQQFCTCCNNPWVV